jgi:hypothetical protein
MEEEVRPVNQPSPFFGVGFFLRGLMEVEGRMKNGTKI